MSKVRVPLHGKPQGYATVDTSATAGATVGADLRWSDGTVVTEAQLRAAVPPEQGEFPITYWRLIQEIPPNVVALANRGTTGIYVITEPGESATRAIEVEDGELTVADGDGVGGNPLLGLADLADAGGGTLQRFERDAKGRVSGSSSATTDDLDEGLNNLYHTDERAQDAAGAVVDGTGDVELAYAVSPARRLWARLSTAIADLINSALQPGDNVSELANDAGYVDAAGAGAAAPVQSVNGETGAVVLSAGDVGAATAAQGALADTATQPGDPVSTLDNDAGYLTTAVRSIVAGANVSIDDTDPENPIVSALGVGGGSVTSVGLSAPTGFSVSGSPVTVSGTLALAYAGGYQGFTTAEASLIASAVQPADLAPVATSGDYNDLDNLPSIPTGTVTSVSMSVPTGLQVSGSPITGAGTLAVAYQSGFVGYTTTEKTKLAGIAAGAQVNVATNLAQGTRTSTTVPVTSSTGSSATLAAATTSLAGVMAAADKTKLDGIASGAQVNVATNIAQGTRTATTVPITSSTGTGATLGAATTSLAGVMAAADKTKLDGVASGATAYTDALARAAAVADSITDGVTNVAPSQSAVFDALASKEPVIASGTNGQFIRGDKTISNVLQGELKSHGPIAALWFQDRSGSSSDEWAWYADNNVARIFRSGDVLEIHPSGKISFPGAPSSDTRLFFAGGSGGPTKAATVNFSTAAGADSQGVVSIQRRDTSDAFEANLWQLYLSNGDNRFLGNISPIVDNLPSCGTAGGRWSVVYSSTGSINTSDAREKTTPRDMTPAEIACGLDISRLPCIFQWLEAIAEKGDEARLHCGPTVQAVIAEMESHGLDPFRYSFVCYDEWPELPEVVQSWDEERDEEGNVTREAGSEIVQEFRPAGDRYSLRPSGLDAFCRRALVADRDALNARLSALESGAA